VTQGRCSVSLARTARSRPLKRICGYTTPFFDITDYEFRCQLIANTLDPLSYATGPGWVDMDLQTSFAWFVSAETDIGSGDFESTQADIELSIRQKSNPANIVTGDIRLIAVSEGGD
jgi:hypothetical protein